MAMTLEKCDAFVQQLKDQGSLIKEFKHFTLFLDRKQYYLGRCLTLHTRTNAYWRGSMMAAAAARCFLWANRFDCESYFDLNDHEWEELRTVSNAVKV